MCSQKACIPQHLPDLSSGSFLSWWLLVCKEVLSGLYFHATDPDFLCLVTKFTLCLMLRPYWPRPNLLTYRVPQDWYPHVPCRHQSSRGRWPYPKCFLAVKMRTLLLYHTHPCLKLFLEGRGKARPTISDSKPFYYKAREKEQGVDRTGHLPWMAGLNTL